MKKLNKDIIDMINADVPESVIIKIVKSKCSAENKEFVCNTISSIKKIVVDKYQ